MHLNSKIAKESIKINDNNNNAVTNYMKYFFSKLLDFLNFNQLH